jgi:hypothetical protein
LVGGARSPLTTKSHPDPYNGIKKGVISHPKPAFGRFWVLRGIYCYFEGQNVQGTMFNSLKKKTPHHLSTTENRIPGCMHVRIR